MIFTYIDGRIGGVWVSSSSWFIWLSLWQVRRSGTHYTDRVSCCLSVLVTLDARLRHYSRDI